MLRLQRHQGGDCTVSWAPAAVLQFLGIFPPDFYSEIPLLQPVFIVCQFVAVHL